MPKMRAGDVRLEIAVERTFHSRLKATCARLHIPVRYLVLDALTERVEFLEEKRRLEEERRKAERETAGSRTAFTSFRRLRGSTLPPVSKPTPLGGTAGGVVDERQVLPDDYARHAEKIYAALMAGSPMEARLCTVEAVAAIKTRRPLTSPADEVIVATLERLVLHKREAHEDTPEIVIDPAKVRTFGEVEVGDGG